jgi:hypothetical protein
LLAAIPKGLHALKGDADRVGVVAVRGVSLAGEICLQTFNSVGPGCDPDTPPASSTVTHGALAQPFKAGTTVPL